MKFILSIIKALFTILLIYISIKHVNFSEAKTEIFSDIGVPLIFVGTIIVLMQTIVAGYRLKPILHLFKTDISGWTGIKMWFIGNFFSQFLISFVGGDAMRIFCLNQNGVQPGSAIRGIFLDRVVGFVVLQILFLLSLPVILPLITDHNIYLFTLILAIACSIIIFGFFSLGMLPNGLSKIKLINRLIDIGTISRVLYISKFITLQVVILSLLVHVCTFVAIFILTKALGGNITILQACCIGSPIILLSMLPISIAGWGVRENAMMIGLGLVNVPADIALIVSIIIGVSFVVGSLPGAIFLLNRRKPFGVGETEIRENYS